MEPGRNVRNVFVLQSAHGRRSEADCDASALCSRSPQIADSIVAAAERPLRPRIGWITYLPSDLAARAKYPADIEVESLADGAALVTLCEEPFGKTDAEGLTRLHALEAALRPI